jgi:hypothetical protein
MRKPANDGIIGRALYHRVDGGAVLIARIPALIGFGDLQRKILQLCCPWLG